MNTKIKIAAGMFAGLVAGTMLVGTAVAAPSMMSAPAYRGYGMMRVFGTSSTFDVPTVAEMNAFMDQYRAVDGSIDVGQMHADVTSGKVTPPHMRGVSGAKSTSKFRDGRTSYRRVSAMMRGYTPSASSAGYNMMGSAY